MRTILLSTIFLYPLSALAELKTSDIRLLLEQKCFKCHGPKKSKAGISFRDFSDELTLWSNRDIWERVLDSLKMEEMPPEDSGKEMTPENRRELIHWIESTMANVDIKRLPRDPGYVPPRRLTRTEYIHTVEDLFGIDFDPGALLPEDQSSHHTFDNEAVVLGVQPLQVEKYMKTAGAVIDQVWSDKQAIDALVFAAPPGARKIQAKASVIASPEQSRKLNMGDDSFAIYVRFKSNGGHGALVSKAKEDQEWEEDAKALFVNEAGILSYDVGWVGQFHGGQQVNDDNWHQVVLNNTEEGVQIFHQGKQIASKDGMTRADKDHFRFKIGEAGAEFVPFNGTISHVSFFNTGFSEEEAEKVSKGGKPSIRASYKWAPQPKQKPAKPMSEDKATQAVLNKFLARAFRRPLTNAELGRYLALHKHARNEGADYHDAFKLPVQTALLSPSFLFRTEAVKSESKPYRLSGLELASRLSYFLWVSTPDMELLSLGHRGELLKVDVLKAQIKRMLKDPRAKRMSEAFMTQWLRTQGLGSSHIPDEDIFGEMSPKLLWAMKQESVELGHEIFSKNRSVMEFITADYSFVNDLLAKHYGITQPGSSDMKRVQLEGDRRGLLTHAASLTVSSSPRRTSPVFRGVWVREVILGQKVPPPPPNTPTLEAAVTENPKSLREKLQAHRSKASCNACHRKIDPLGFALESFDAVGRERGEALDTVGRLSDGTEFEGHAGLIELIEGNRKDLFLRNLSKKLLSFALGRELILADEVTLAQIDSHLKESGNSSHAMIEAIVLSHPFLYKKEPTPKKVKK